MTTENHLFCFGIGYTAIETMKTLSKDSLNSWKFSGTKRTPAEGHGIKVYEFDELIMLPHDITHILISIPPRDQGDLVIETFHNQIAKLPNLKWVGYLSSTGVYGDHKGGWVDENTQVNPSNPFSARRLQAEEQWLELFKEHKAPAHIFRLSGIYGPGRSAIDKVLSGKARIIEKEGQYFSRIHVEDIAQVLVRSMLTPTPGEIYNLADDLPTPPPETIEYACKLLNIEPPKPVKYEDADLSDMAKTFYEQSRRVKNDKIKDKLKIKLKYPTYKEGLDAQL